MRSFMVVCAIINTTLAAFDFATGRGEAALFCLGAAVLCALVASLPGVEEDE